MPRLLFDPDWGADPLWDYDSGSMVRLERLPLSAQTREAIRRWRDEWEDLAHRQSHADDVEAGMADGPAEPPSAAERAANAAEMERLWGVLRDELGSEWQIALAHDEDGRRYVRWHPSEPYREVHEQAGRRFWG